MKTFWAPLLYASISTRVKATQTKDGTRRNLAAAIDTIGHTEQSARGHNRSALRNRVLSELPSRTEISLVDPDSDILDTKVDVERSLRRECSSNEALWTFVLVTDDYAWETSWELKNEAGDIITAGPPAGLNYERRTRYLGNMCLAYGQYVLTLKDKMGDGNCCSFGEGSISVSINGNMILEDSDDTPFTEKDLTFIILPESSRHTVTPTSNPASLPTKSPSLSAAALQPTRQPSQSPTRGPTIKPTSRPTLPLPELPSEIPSLLLTDSPSEIPERPSVPPTSTTDLPSELPSILPSVTLSENPSAPPTDTTDIPSEWPSILPTETQSENPSIPPTDETDSPSFISENPSVPPTNTGLSEQLKDKKPTPTKKPKAPPPAAPPANTPSELNDILSPAPSSPMAIENTEESMQGSPTYPPQLKPSYVPVQDFDIILAYSKTSGNIDMDELNDIVNRHLLDYLADNLPNNFQVEDVEMDIVEVPEKFVFLGSAKYRASGNAIFGGNSVPATDYLNGIVANAFVGDGHDQFMDLLANAQDSTLRSTRIAEFSLQEVELSSATTSQEEYLPAESSGPSSNAMFVWIGLVSLGVMLAGLFIVSQRRSRNDNDQSTLSSNDLDETHCMVQVHMPPKEMFDLESGGDAFESGGDAFEVMMGEEESVKILQTSYQPSPEIIEEDKEELGGNEAMAEEPAIVEEVIKEPEPTESVKMEEGSVKGLAKVEDACQGAAIVDLVDGSAEDDVAAKDKEIADATEAKKAKETAKVEPSSFLSKEKEFESTVMVDTTESHDGENIEIVAGNLVPENNKKEDGKAAKPKFFKRVRDSIKSQVKRTKKDGDSVGITVTQSKALEERSQVITPPSHSESNSHSDGESKGDNSHEHQELQPDWGMMSADSSIWENMEDTSFQCGIGPTCLSTMTESSGEDSESMVTMLKSYGEEDSKSMVTISRSYGEEDSESRVTMSRSYGEEDSESRVTMSRSYGEEDSEDYSEEYSADTSSYSEFADSRSASVPQQEAATKSSWFTRK